MTYPTLDPRQAQTVYDLRRESYDPDPSDYVKFDGPAEQIRDDVQYDGELANVVREFEAGAKRAADAWFEGRVGIWLHERVTDPEAPHDRGYWRYLSLFPLNRLVLKRHQKGSAMMPSKSNYGLESLNEGFLRRAWLRADLSHVVSAPPGERYTLALRGDQDFWRSFVIRPGYRVHRGFVRALVRFQYETEDAPGRLVAGDATDGIRVLAKRVARLQANTAYAMLDEDECLELIREMAKGLAMRDGRPYTGAGEP